MSKKYVDRETSKKVRKAGDPFLKVSFISSAPSTFRVPWVTDFFGSGLTRLKTTMSTTSDPSLGNSDPEVTSFFL